MITTIIYKQVFSVDYLKPQGVTYDELNLEFVIDKKNGNKMANHFDDRNSKNSNFFARQFFIFYMDVIKEYTFAFPYPRIKSSRLVICSTLFAENS